MQNILNSIIYKNDINQLKLKLLLNVILNANRRKIRIYNLNLNNVSWQYLKTNQKLDWPWYQVIQNHNIFTRKIRIEDIIYRIWINICNSFNII